MLSCAGVSRAGSSCGCYVASGSRQWLCGRSGAPSIPECGVAGWRAVGSGTCRRQWRVQSTLELCTPAPVGVIRLMTSGRGRRNEPGRTSGTSAPSSEGTECQKQSQWARRRRAGARARVYGTGARGGSPVTRERRFVSVFRDRISGRVCGARAYFREGGRSSGRGAAESKPRPQRGGSVVPYSHV